MPSIPVLVHQLPHFHGLFLPRPETAHAAGLDLAAAVEEDLIIPSLGRVLVPTGLTVAIPTGYELQIRPRSGLALKYGITCLNTPGTIDPDYRGEIKVLLANLGTEPFTVVRGMRIAQMVLAQYQMLHWHPVQELPGTDRGTGAFGSTGH